MPILKIIPKKKSGRLLVVVRRLLIRRMRFEVWLQWHHPHLYESDHLKRLKKALDKIDRRIQKAINREKTKPVKTPQTSIE